MPQVAAAGELTERTRDEEPLFEAYAAGPGGAQLYRSRFDVLVCTPGRLIDLLFEEEGFTLKDVAYVVSCLRVLLNTLGCGAAFAFSSTR